jgi:hypothetical protein
MSEQDREQERVKGRSSGTGRLLAGVTWVVLLLGLWLWGREVTDVRHGIAAPTTGDMAAAGRPPDVKLPPAHRPLTDALPQRVDIPGLGVQAPVVARGLDARGALDPPPYDQPGVVVGYHAGQRQQHDHCGRLRGLPSMIHMTNCYFEACIPLRYSRGQSYSFPVCIGTRHLFFFLFVRATARVPTERLGYWEPPRQHFESLSFWETICIATYPSLVVCFWHHRLLWTWTGVTRVIFLTSRVFGSPL